MSRTFAAVIFRVARQIVTVAQASAAGALHWRLGRLPLANLHLPVLDSGLECGLRDGRWSLSHCPVAQIEARMMPRAFNAFILD